jgi:hypothetical protein
VPRVSADEVRAASGGLSERELAKVLRLPAQRKRAG